MSNSVATQGVSELTAAAEALIKAASAHVETTSIAVGQETVQELKKISKASSILALKLDTLNERLSLLETNTNDKISKSNTQMILSLDNLNKSITLQMKHQRIDWAFAHADYGSFDCTNDYKGSNRYYNYEKSTGIVKTILSNFRKNYGTYITNFAKSGVDHGKDAKAAFRNAVVEQLFVLLGTKPRLASEGETCIIYYE
jgi:hypothetical protein